MPEPFPEPAHGVRLAQASKERGPVQRLVHPQDDHGEQDEEGVEAVEEDEGARCPPGRRDPSQGSLADGDEGRGDVVDEQFADSREREAAHGDRRLDGRDPRDLAWYVDEAGVVPARGPGERLVLWHVCVTACLLEIPQAFPC